MRRRGAGWAGPIFRMSPEELKQKNEELAGRPAVEIIRWAIEHANGRAVVSTNFRPYE